MRTAELRARVDELTTAAEPRGKSPRAPLGRGRLTGRLQVAGGHPRLDDDRRRTVVDGVHHAALPAAGRPVLVPLGQQPGPATRALRQAGDPAVPGQDRTQTVLQGSKLRVGADRPGRSDRVAIGQGRAVAPRHASCHQPSMTPSLERTFPCRPAGRTRSRSIHDTDPACRPAHGTWLRGARRRPARPAAAGRGRRPPGRPAHARCSAGAVLCDQLDANGEGGHRVLPALILAPRHAAGTIGPGCYWAIINGMRLAER